MNGVEQAGRRHMASGLRQEQCERLGRDTWLASESRVFSASIEQSLMTTHPPLPACVEQAEIRKKLSLS